VTFTATSPSADRALYRMKVEPSCTTTGEGIFKGLAWLSDIFFLRRVAWRSTPADTFSAWMRRKGKNSVPQLATR
jgi:hypothetical protein